MDTRSSQWEEEKDSTEEQVRSMALKKYNQLLTSGRWSNKDPKDDPILDIVWVEQKLADGSKKSSDKSNTSNSDSTKGYPAYTRDITQ